MLYEWTGYISKSFDLFLFFTGVMLLLMAGEKSDYKTQIFVSDNCLLAWS